MNELRVLIISTAPPAQLHHLLRRILADIPDLTVVRVLHWPEGLSPGSLVKSGSIVSGFINKVRKTGSAAFHRILRWIHAFPTAAVNADVSLQEVRTLCTLNRIPLQVCSELASKRGFDGSEVQQQDVTLIYGRSGPESNSMPRPRLGVISLERQTIVHPEANRDEKVLEQIQVRHLSDDQPDTILAQRVFTIESYDCEPSIDLKARLLGIDCLIDAIRILATGCPGPLQQTPFAPGSWAGRAKQRMTTPSRKQYKPVRGRPFYKLVARMLAYPALRGRNRRYAVQRRFPVVILFHHVVTDRRKYLGIPTEQFRKHVRFLKRHYHIASLPEAINMLERDEVPIPTVVLTFDDGYEDNFLCLRAVAEAENVPVTLFICTQNVAERESFQHDLDRGERGFPALSWDQVRYLDKHSVTIGSHTRTHLDCSTADANMLLTEIGGALEDLKRELDHDVAYFSFPKGKPRNMPAPARAIAQQKYRYVFSACGGINFAPLAPGTILKRCSHPDSLIELDLLLQGILDFADRGD
jgi:peptidoglycan/xylan/chitin deacetylase (PgdA/CDA1 family)